MRWVGNCDVLYRACQMVKSKAVVTCHKEVLKDSIRHGSPEETHCNPVKVCEIRTTLCQAAMPSHLHSMIPLVSFV